MTNGEKIKEIFSDCFIVRRLSDNKIVHLVCTEEFLNSEYKEPTPKNDLGVDCISRDAVLKPYEGLKDEDTISVWLIRKNIEQQPFVKQEPKIGHWIDTDEWRETVDGFEQWGYFRKCSKCGYVFKFLEIDNYCPNCGADMREVKE